MALSYLPSDILFNIFTLLNDLQDLNAVVSTNTSLHQTFQDQRSAILRNVFSNQLSTWFVTDASNQKYHSGIRQATRFVKYVNGTIGKCSMTSDRLTLHIAAWDVYLDFESLPWLISTLPQDLVSACEALDRPDLALSYTSMIWERILADGDFKLKLNHSHNPTYWRVKFWAEKLAEKYYDQGLPDAAVQIMLEWCSITESHHHRQIIPLLKKYGTSPDEQVRIIKFFDERVQNEYAPSEKHRSRLVPMNITWTYSLLEMLIEFGKYKDASNHFNEFKNIFTELRMDPMLLVGRSRGLIKTLVDKEIYDLAVTIYQDIFVLLSGMSQNTPSHYLGWASSYIALLYRTNQDKEALAVEEECWEQIREHLLRTKRSALSYSGQNAAFTLYKSYEHRGQIEQAKRVRWEYECLARECSDAGNSKSILWPGDMADPSYFSTYEQNKYQELESRTVGMVEV